MPRVLVVLVACGGSTPPADIPSNRASNTEETIEPEAETIEGTAENERAVTRRQAIAQARIAGILGPRPPEVLTGPLDKTAVQVAIEKRIDSIQSCYEIQLLDKPTLRGTTIVEFTVGGDGKVIAATARGFDPGVERCVADVIEAIPFPKPAAPRVHVRYPFTFKPAS